MSISEKLSSIQNELKAPKGQYNSFGKYKYRSLEDILEAVKPILAREKISLIITDSIIEVGGRVYVEATAVLRFKDEEVIVRASAREPESKKGMDEAQITGATSSYARKYALNGLFSIDDSKDADATNTHGKEANPQKEFVARQEKQKAQAQAPDPSLAFVKFVKNKNTTAGSIKAQVAKGS